MGDKFVISTILADPGADTGGEGKSKQAEKYDTKENYRTARRAPGDNVQKTCVFLAPIRSHKGSDRLELVW